MNKKIISILAIVLFGTGLTNAAEQPVTAKTKCYKGIVEIPCPQPEDDYSGKDVKDVKPLLPHPDPGNEIIRDNATDLIWQKATEPREDYSGKNVKDVKPLLPHPDPGNEIIRDNATGLMWQKATELQEDYSGKDAQNVKPLPPYTDLGNGIIRDNATGLMWQKATAPGIGSGEYPDRYTWDQANAYCADLSLGGYTDWRLPDVNELQALVEYSRYNPSINTTYFPNTRAFRYWSSTIFSIDTNGAWYVSFHYGYTRNCIKGSHYYVRAVHSGK